MPAHWAQQLSAGLRRVPMAAIWAVGLVPLAWTIWDGVTGGLGVDPVARLEHRLGDWALYLLIAGLAVTPVMRLSRVNLTRLRRPLGLLAFTYAALHVLAWAGADMGFLWGQMGRDIVKRPWLTIGMAAALMLVPLAATSSDAAIRRLGATRWRALHRLVYAAVPLAGIHAALVGKVLQTWQVVCLLLIAGLLALRVITRRRRPAARPA